ncbi:MAG: hypothetical protein WC351_00955 [Candidatus Izemoplasmatales bacterium]|jgi:hypothetical protein
MKKKLYDFSTSTAIIVLLAYFLVLFVLIYTICSSPHPGWFVISLTAFLTGTLIYIIIIYGLMAPTISSAGIKHRKKQIDHDNITWTIRYNPRYRYDEFIFRDRTIADAHMTRRERARAEIAIQYFPKYEPIILKFIGNNQEQKAGEHHEK